MENLTQGLQNMRKLCQHCDAIATHRLKDYFILPMATNAGSKDLFLCGQHTKEWDDYHPFSPRAQPLNAPIQKKEQDRGDKT